MELKRVRNQKFICLKFKWVQNFDSVHTSLITRTTCFEIWSMINNGWKLSLVIYVKNSCSCEQPPPLPLSFLVVLLNLSSSKPSKNSMSKSYGSELHIAKLYTKIKEFLFSTFLVFFSIFWYLWVSSSNSSKK